MKKRHYVTLNWNKHWRTTEEPEEARRFAIKMADKVSDFIQDKNKVINSIADYGCGPATLLFILAKRFPYKEFYGFDIAESIIKRNVKKHRNLICKIYTSNKMAYQILVRKENLT